jgi:hypothetical protein
MAIALKAPPVFTLHTSSINIFSVQDKCTAALSFSKRKDAVHFARLLESKFAVDHVWPTIEFSNVNNWIVKDVSNDIKMNNVYITEWDSDSLYNICINSNMPLVEVEKIVFGTDKMNIKGKYISWDVEPKYYIDYFNHLIYEQSS